MEKEKAIKKRGIDTSKFNESVHPTDDFFEFANGTWIRENPIPDHLSRWGGFSTLNEEQDEKLKDLLEDASRQVLEDGTIEKVVSLYKMGMNVDKLNQEGIDPIKDDLDKINDVNSAEDIAAISAYLHRRGIGVIWSVDADKDMRGSDTVYLYAGQGGLGLPDRDYYFDSDKNIEREKYLELISNLFSLIGYKDREAQNASNVVMRIEASLADASMTRTELRDLEAQYNKMSFDEFRDISPGINWNKYFEELGIPNSSELIVTQPEFFKKVEELFSSVSIEDWKTYLTWHYVLSVASYLSDDLYDAKFDFYGKVIAGTKTKKPRWQRCLGVIDAYMGEALGRLYVKKYFPPEAKEKIENLVENLKDVLGDRINRLEWMSDDTKQKALEKLSKFTTKLGYPDKWKDYSGLEIKDDGYVRNILRARMFRFNYEMSKIGGLVDKEEWHMPPQTVNAYYHPFFNEIVFPAGILQAPFFDVNQDDALNYGGIGSVIGHEITHAFDDKGSTFDGDGNMENWWNEEDRKFFEKLADKLASQYEECTVLDNLKIKGKLTSGENIADLGGINIAFEAYEKSLSEGSSFSGDIDGFSPRQRFFLAYAQIWCSSVRDETIKARITTDPHSPPKFRVLVPLSNIDAFYDAFECKEGDDMYRSPGDRVKIW